MTEKSIKQLLSEIPAVNPYGEKVTLVAATKTRTVEEINFAVSCGVTDIGENKAQEFRDKFDKVLPCNYHFFGRLQKNKVKYLIGKACLIQSVDSVELAEVISSLSVKNGVTTDILLEVNQGEEQKGGFDFSDVEKAYAIIAAMPNVRVKGLMTVMPVLSEKTAEMCLQTRRLYDILKRQSEAISVLSLGMSADYKIAIENGSNMIRLGQAIFGKRNYEV